MKKTALFFVVLLSVCVCIGLTACAKEKKAEEDLQYVLDISLSENFLTGTETVTFNNVYCDNLTESVFHLYPNAYGENASRPAYVQPLERYGGIEIKSVSLQDGTACSFRLSEDNEYLTIEHSEVKKDSEASFVIEFETTIPSGDLRFSHNGDRYSLSSFYPQIAVYEEGFRQDAFSTIGDPFYSSCGAYDITFTCDSNQVVACSLPCKETVTSGERQTNRYVGENVRDLAFALSPNYNVISGKAGEVSVYYFYEEDEQAKETLQTAISAISVFSDEFGGYPYETFSIARVPFKEEGMEYTGLVYLSDKSVDVQGTVVHETAHQWWYGVVGSDCIKESYMDEGLTTFCSAYYYELTGNSEAFDKEIKGIRRAYGCYERLQQKRKTDANLAMNKSVYEYTEYQYTMVQYYKGAMMFANLYELYGREKFAKTLKNYYENNKFSFGGREKFIEAAKSEMGDIGGLMDGWIGERVVATTFAEME